MSETMKIILTIIMVGIALAALIINSIGNIRADMRDIRGEMRDIRTEVANNRVEINGLRIELDGLRTALHKFGQDLQVLTDRVARVEELVQDLLLPHQDAVARASGDTS